MDNVGVSTGIAELERVVGRERVGDDVDVLGLTCGTSYTLALDAYDAAGNRSTTATIHIGDRRVRDGYDAAKRPAGTLRRVDDPNERDAELERVDGQRRVSLLTLHVPPHFLVTTTPNLTYTFTGLTCGTLYSLALEAYDAAGNVPYRPEAVAVVSTNACSDGQAL